MKNISKHAIILAAGKGTRMKSEKPKCACEILGKPMITHIVNACKEAGLDKIVVLLVIKGSISKIYLVQLFNMLFKMNN